MEEVPVADCDWVDEVELLKSPVYYASLTISSDLLFDLGEADLDFDLPLAALLIVTSWNSNFGG